MKSSSSSLSTSRPPQATNNSSRSSGSNQKRSHRSVHYYYYNFHFKRQYWIILVWLILVTIQIESIWQYSFAFLTTDDSFDPVQVPEEYVLNKTTTINDDSLGSNKEGSSSQLSQMPRLLMDHDDNTLLQPTSACVLFSDDDQRLVEWMAYHYYAAGLRTLVIATNPLSSSRPTYILDRWRPYMDHIVEWNDEDFGYERLYKHTSLDVGNTSEHLANHRKRQTVFYRECIAYLKKRQLASKQYGNSSSTTSNSDDGWTWFHDLDEYVTLDDKVVPNASAYMAQASGLLKAWKHSRMNEDLERNEWLFKPQQTRRSAKRHQKCYSIPRRVVSVKGSLDEFNRTEIVEPNVIDAAVPDFLEASRLETIKHRYRVSPNMTSINLNGKCVLDITRVTNLNRTKMTVHRVVRDICPESTPNIIFVINHYLGSWRLYARPSDARRGVLRNWQSWHYKSQLGDEPNDTIRPWLQSFANNVGVELTKTLLQPVPLPPAYDKPINMSEWFIPPERIHDERIRYTPEFQQYMNSWIQRYNEAMMIANITNSSRPLYVL